MNQAIKKQLEQWKVELTDFLVNMIGMAILGLISVGYLIFFLGQLALVVAFVYSIYYIVTAPDSYVAFIEVIKLCRIIWQDITSYLFNK